MIFVLLIAMIDVVCSGNVHPACKGKQVLNKANTFTCRKTSCFFSPFKLNIMSCFLSVCGFSIALLFCATDTVDKTLSKVVTCETRGPSYKVCNTTDLDDGADCLILTVDDVTRVIGPGC